MTYQGSEFKYIERGYGRAIMLVPGWATDYRIFDGLDLEFDYLMPVRCFPDDFASKFITALDANGLGKINILGWSMGAFLAQDILSRHPDRVSGKTILVSARPAYDKDALAKIESYLKKSRTAYLSRFYCDCFAGAEIERSYSFRAGLIKEYLDTMSLDTLLGGLAYLREARLDFETLIAADVGFIHGTDDRIAPAAELTCARERLPSAVFRFMEGAGHMPFYSGDFKRVVYEMYGR